jgi:hypothetical protein
MYSVRKGDDEERRSVRTGAGQRQPGPVMMRAARITLWHGREKRGRGKEREKEEGADDSLSFVLVCQTD